MDKYKNINSSDLRLYPAAVLPGFLAFFFLGLAASENEWIYWLMCIGGWYISSMIWWQLYRYFVIDKIPPSRKLFYAYCLTAQLSLAVLVLIFIMIQFVQ